MKIFLPALKNSQPQLNWGQSPVQWRLGFLPCFSSVFHGFHSIWVLVHFLTTGAKIPDTFIFKEDWCILAHSFSIWSGDCKGRRYMMEGPEQSKAAHYLGSRKQIEKGGPWGTYVLPGSHPSEPLCQITPHFSTSSPKCCIIQSPSKRPTFELCEVLRGILELNHNVALQIWREPSDGNEGIEESKRN